MLVKMMIKFKLDRKMKKSNFIFNKPLIVTLGLMILYFAQIYPYIHFHHTHNNHGSQIVVSSHPLHQESNNHSEQHKGEHQHEGNEHIVGDWNYVKPVPKLPLKFSTNFLWVTNIDYMEKFEQFTIVQTESIYIQPFKILFSLDLSRGPPPDLS